MVYLVLYWFGRTVSLKGVLIMKSIFSMIFRIFLKAVLFVILLIVTLIAAIIKIAAAIYCWCFPLLFVAFCVYTFLLYHSTGLSRQMLTAAASAGLFAIIYRVIPCFLVIMDKGPFLLGRKYLLPHTSQVLR